MKKLLGILLLLFAFFEVIAQNNYSKTYNDTYNNIVKYYDKPATTTNYNYSTPSSNNSSYTPSYNSYGSGNYSNSNYSSYPDPSSPTYYSYSDMYFARTAEGTGKDDKFRITKSDGVIYGFLTHPAGLQTASFTVKFYKFINDKSTLMDEITYYTDKKDYTSLWFQYDFAKYGAGKYHLEATNSNGKQITGGLLTIKADFSSDIPVMSNSPAPKNEIYRNAESEHFKNSTVVFCQNVDENWNPVGVYSSFTLTPGNGVVKMFVENAATLKTTAITAKVHLQKSGVYSFVDEQTYNFNADAVNSQKAAMNYDFSKNGIGSYRVDFYSKEGVFINSGYVTIVSP